MMSYVLFIRWYIIKLYKLYFILTAVYNCVGNLIKKKRNLYSFSVRLLVQEIDDIQDDR